MATKLNLTHPWLVAVWPGMGHVALNAGYYLLAKLGMDVAAELEAGDLFDIDHVDVKGGRIQPARRPRNRFFVGHDPVQVAVRSGEISVCRHPVEHHDSTGRFHSVLLSGTGAANKLCQNQART